MRWFLALPLIFASAAAFAEQRTEPDRCRDYLKAVSPIMKKYEELEDVLLFRPSMTGWPRTETADTRAFVAVRETEWRLRAALSQATEAMSEYMMTLERCAGPSQ